MDRPGAIIEAVARLGARDRVVMGERQVTEVAQVRALLDAVSILDRAGVAQALIGGIAVGVRSGVPRATMNVDLAVRFDANTEALVVSMVEGGFTHKGTYAHSVTFRDGAGEPVQLTFDPEFDAAIGRAEPVRVAGRTVRVVTTENLVAMKQRAADAPTRRRSKALRDLADIELLRGDVGDIDEGW